LIDDRTTEICTKSVPSSFLDDGLIFCACVYKLHNNRGKTGKQMEKGMDQITFVLTVKV